METDDRLVEHPAECDETVREMYRFLDDELPAEVAAHLREHLQGCSDCLEAFDFEAELRAAIRRKCDTTEVPAELIVRIRACFDVEL